MDNLGNGIFIPGMEGPDISGTWYDPKTGNSITVRDTYFEDGQMRVRTSDGRVLDYNIMQNYIKSDKPIPKIETPEKQKINGNSDIPPEIQSLLEEPKMTQNGISNPLVDPFYQPLSKKQQKTVELSNEKIIDKAFKKVKTSPLFDIFIHWEQYPLKEIQMLIDIMDVPVVDIVNYCIKKYVNDETYKQFEFRLKELIEKECGIENIEELLEDNTDQNTSVQSEEN